MTTRHIGVVYGTRPEAIKVAPLLADAPAHVPLRYSGMLTGQHPDMVRHVNDVFGIEPIVDLGVYRAGQGLGHLAGGVLDRLTTFLTTADFDAVLVQGDTTSAFAAAVSAFYLRIPVIHLEAGLRTGNLASPFPEEANRRGITQFASLHLAPTPTARENLLREGIDPRSIVVTGNTGIDALLLASRRPPHLLRPDLAAAIGEAGRLVLVTTHRRESWGPGIERIAHAVAALAARFPDVRFLLPLHANPVVRSPLTKDLGHLDNVRLVEPVSYGDFVHVMAASYFVLTDSGGIQEEAPSLGKPVLVMRDTTERPEAVAAGTARLVGTSEDDIVAGSVELLTDERAYRRMAVASNPFGDGHAARRAHGAIAELLGCGARSPDFEP